ncbi:MAG TPA: hypothetical protein VFB62_23220 [Polyangiaceae bacterium]|jgi:hypothetical protein|nr:hypothetical protein [Polyangiaceae bacterium]
MSPNEIPAEITVETKVHPAGTFQAGVLRWGYFLLLNAIAGSVAVALFVAVLYADGLDPYMQGTYEWLLAHPGVTSMLAFSPLACSLLVGWGYAQRARKRRLAAAQRAELVKEARAKRQQASEQQGSEQQASEHPA